MLLPKSLGPWAQPLAGFSLEAAESLTPLLRRLAAAIGPFPEAAHSASGDPDGLSGLSFKGPYDRLLVSEWLLAEEMPDEFLRRAAMREHLFLNLNRKDRIENRLSCVLFDAGPRQLGSPRLAHLALLVVFYQRALAANANFCWGFLQDEQRHLTTDLSRASVHRLLAARTFKSATEYDASDWQARLAKDQIHDLWTVTSPAGPRLSKSFIDVEDILDPLARQVRVTVSSHSQRREIVLDLPSERTCAQLLRDPYSNRPAASLTNKSQPRPVYSIAFDPIAKTISALAEDGGILVFQIPNSPAARLNPPKWYRREQNEVIVAMIRARRSVLIVSYLDPQRLRLRHIGSPLPLRDGDYHTQGRFFSSSSINPKRAYTRLLKTAFSPALSTAWICDDAGTLFRIQNPTDAGQSPRALIHAVKVRTLSQVDGRLRFVGQRSDEEPVCCFCDEASKPLSLNPGPALYGWAGALADPKFGFLAVLSANGETWSLIGETFHETSPAAGISGKVLGVFRPDNSHAPGLLVLKDDHRTLNLEWAGWQRKLFTTPSPIFDCATTPAAPLIAYLTDDQTLSVYDGLRDRTLCHYHSAENE